MNKFNFINLMADETDVELNLYGEIVSDDIKELYDFFGVQSSSPGGFKEFLKANTGKNLTLRINSPGGSFLVGVEMYNALMDYKGTTTAIIDGTAASAATLPLVACNKVKMSAPATIMIHCASMLTQGTRSDLKKDIEVLKTIDNALANAYELKTGMSRDELLKLMADETWMDAKEAKRLKFADEIDEKLVLPENIIKNIVNNQKMVYNVYKPKTEEPAHTVAQDNSVSMSFEFIKSKIKNKRSL